jgi:lysophospholipase L1-like esterase
LLKKCLDFRYLAAMPATRVEVEFMRVRLLALLSAAALFVLAAMPASATSEGHNYLALGDSVAYGYSPLIAFAISKGILPPDAALFKGYPDTAAASLDLNEVNSSCPGETTAGFISRTAANDFLCLPFLASGIPLHTSYSGSQLDFALSYLSAHPTTSLVTIDIGANDVFKLATACGGQNTSCFAGGLSAVLTGIDANLRFIFAELRNVARYHHAIVVLTYYSLSYDPATAAGTQALNAPIIDAANAYGALVASGFDAFEGPALATPDKSSCEAGLLIVLAPGVCDVHPTPAGRDLLAAAIVGAIAASCPAESAMGCMELNQG